MLWDVRRSAPTPAVITLLKDFVHSLLTPLAVVTLLKVTQHLKIIPLVTVTLQWAAALCTDLAAEILGTTILQLGVKYYHIIDQVVIMLD